MQVDASDDMLIFCGPSFANLHLKWAHSLILIASPATFVSISNPVVVIIRWVTKQWILTEGQFEFEFKLVFNQPHIIEGEGKSFSIVSLSIPYQPL
jgi:hypothetical protein